jgi:hypothetical protein
MVTTYANSLISRRAALGGIGAAGLGAALAARPSLVAAQEASTADHPLVGSWLLDVFPDVPTNAFEAFILHADGTYVEANADGSVRIGAWEATGPTTANLTIVAYDMDANGASAGATKVRVAITLREDGDTYDAQFTLERIAPDGSSAGQAGPGQSVATRMTVEPPGETTMTVEEFFGAPPATPAA